MRYALTLLLALTCSLSSFGAVVDTPLNYKSGGATVVNIPTAVTVNATENTLTVSITPGNARTVMFTADTAWYYRSSSGGTSVSVAANQTLVLLIPANCVIYFVRQTIDGTLTILPLK